MRAVITAALFVGLNAASVAQPTKCYVCEKLVAGKHFLVEDKAHGGQVAICSECADLESRCFACGLPVKSPTTKLTDGRFLCSRDAKTAIQDNEEANRICLRTREDLDRYYSRFLTFPSTNVLLNFVD